MRKFIGSANGTVPVRQGLTLGLLVGLVVLVAMLVLSGVDAGAAPEPDPLPCPGPPTTEYEFHYHHSDCANRPHYPTLVKVYKVYCDGRRVFQYQFCMP